MSTNRESFAALRDALAFTQTQAADFIAKKTKRPCALRTVQAWEALPELSSARACPDWAVELLQVEVVKRAASKKRA